MTAAVLYYFGLTYTRSWYAYFGVDARFLDLSASDYMVRSINGAFFPVVLAVLAVVGIVASQRVPIVAAARSRRPRRVLRMWAGGVAVAGIALGVAVVVGVAIRGSLPRTMSVGLPLMLLTSVGLIAYRLYLQSSYATLLRRGGGRRPPQPTPWVLILALLILGFLGTFWAVDSYAADRAERDARAAEERGFPGQPVAVIFSVDRLAVGGGGSKVDAITTPGEKYRFQYSGLLLLARSNDKYILIPHKWSAQHRDRVFVINTGDTLRIDLAPHP
ncbi:hypothetical protein IRT45_14515 [Nocardia sp. BSTN01]|uniref:hypothetical protein n=1 Tax=Nocardia sp. BSTN01 TaxID=2783665 RepID=UPI00188FFC3D|nr:hypothetical protein [Nocardia sp. BSTN01]MBF4998365.1 hypothetical protein [Nocardia sp. BSTN01]